MNTPVSSEPVDLETNPWAGLGHALATDPSPVKPGTLALFLMTVASLIMLVFAYLPGVLADVFARMML